MQSFFVEVWRRTLGGSLRTRPQVQRGELVQPAVDPQDWSRSGATDCATYARPALIRLDFMDTLLPHLVGHHALNDAKGE